MKNRVKSIDTEKESLVFNDSNFVDLYMRVYSDPQRYEGCTIEVEGIFYISEYNDNVYYMVIRNGVGMCEYHEYELIGFEFEYDAVDAIEDGQWIKVSGTLGVYYEGENGIMVIRDAQVEALEEEGSVFVYK